MATKKTAETTNAAQPTKLSPNAELAANLTALLRARITLIWMRTSEEERSERMLQTSSAAAKMGLATWDCNDGLLDSQGRSGGKSSWQAPGLEASDPRQMLSYIRQSTERRVYVLRDVHKWLDPIVLRGVRSLCRELQKSPLSESRALVVLAPPSEPVPPELQGHATVIDMPLPGREEIGQLLDALMAAQPQLAPLVNGAREAAIDAAVGLIEDEAASCFSKSLVKLGRVDPREVSAEKKRVVARDGLLTWIDPDPRGFDAVGGLELLKKRALQLGELLTKAARDAGCDVPKGICVVGVPGCGKSMSAKATAAALQLPLLRFDLGALRSKYVGESESNLRKAQQIAEAIAPCVLWLDEMEKGFAGSTGPAGDGGVAADALGQMLTWMQDKTAPVIIVGTANDVSKMPSPLLRKGRFDALLWVDLPTTRERVAVLAATLRGKKRDPERFDLAEVARATRDFTSSEIAACVSDGLFAAFHEKRELLTSDLLEAAAATVPLSRTMADELRAMREWGQTRAQPASLPDEEDNIARSTARALDLND